MYCKYVFQDKVARLL